MKLYKLLDKADRKKLYQLKTDLEAKRILKLLKARREERKF